MPDPLSLQIVSESDARQIDVPPRRAAGPLTEILRTESLPLNTRCGERGLCQGCMIELVQGRLANTETGQTIAVEAGRPPRMLRACRHRLVEGGGATTIAIPARSLLAHQPQAITSFQVNVPFAHDPMPGAATGAEPRVGVAIDIGTTTVAIALIDLSTGESLAQGARFNEQIHLGDNVLTRINVCTVEPKKTALLQEHVVNKTIAPLLDELLDVAGVSRDQLSLATCAGNTVMLHLLAGVNPRPLGVAPFEPVFKEHRVVTAREIELFWPMQAEAGPGGPARGDLPFHLLPSAAGYVGADLCAGAFASGLAYDDGPVMLVDVGTNGEILLKHGQTLLGCATAAGPAFEGGMLDSGLRAGDGAISHVRLSANPFGCETELIGPPRTKPIGLCGTAYIDFLAQARRVQLLTPTGRFDPDAADAAAHIDGAAHTRRFVAARSGQGDGAGIIGISETDIANLLQAKAAIAAGIICLLERQGLRPGDIKTLYLAGGFGLHLDLDSAIGCGLLPGFRREQIQLIGNSSLAGAYLSLVDQTVLDELQRIAERMEVIELNLDPSFEGTFIDQLMLP